MTNNERWEHTRNLEEIVDRIGELIVSIILMSVKQVNEKYQPLKKRLDSERTEDIEF